MVLFTKAIHFAVSYILHTYIYTEIQSYTPIYTHTKTDPRALNN